MKQHAVLHKHNKMTTAPVGGLIAQMAIPTTISMLITSFYVMADTYFVGKIDTQSTAAVGVSFSVMAIIQAFGFFFGHGSGNFMSRALGAKDLKSASQMASTGFFYSFFTGLFIMVAGLLFLTPLCKILGSTETILPYAENYLQIILWGAPFMAASMTLNNQLRFQGTPVYAMIGIVIGAVLNVALDPILIFTFNMGVKGAAYSTLISQICSFITLVALTFRKNSISIRPKDFSWNKSYVKEIIYGGSPSLCRQSLVSIATIMMNVAAGAFGDAAIAGVSIVTRICLFINSFVIGLGQGFQPVCGFNYGAGLYPRVREGFWLCVKVGGIFLTFCSIFGYIYSPEIVSWFRAEDPQVIEIGARTLRWQLITLPLGSWVILCNMMLQTIRKPAKAIILSSARQGLFFIPLILILPTLLGLQGVEMCQAVADFCSFILAIPLTIPVLKTLHQNASPRTHEYLGESELE